MLKSGTAAIIFTAEDNTPKTYTLNFNVATGIDEVSDANKLNVYFNSLTNELIISEVENIGSVEIIDVYGRKLVSVNKQITNVINLDKYNLRKNSIYFIRLFNALTNEQIIIKAVR